jgi:guanylate kinase
MHDLTDFERLVLHEQGEIPKLVIVITGPSGVGKNTIIKRLLTKNPRLMKRLITYTTRKARKKEIEGEQYHFVTNDQFIELGDAGRLMEWDPDKRGGHDVYKLGKWYSMPADIFEGMLPSHHLLIAEVDTTGMKRLCERYPHCITIFVTATPEILRERIQERPDEEMDAHALAHRLKTAHDQYQEASKFDYIIFNHKGRLRQTIRAIESIILAERSRIRHRIDLQPLLASPELVADGNHR